MNRHSREISEIVPAHARSCAHVEIICTSLSFGGDECDDNSFSLLHVHTQTQKHKVCMFVCLLFWVYLTAGCLTLIRCRSSYNHTHQHAYLCVCMYVFVLFLFVLLSIPCSWLPNSLILFDTERFICTTISCRPCHRTFSPGFHRSGECLCFSWLCFSWLSTEIVCLIASVDFLSLRDMYFPVFLVWLVWCVCLLFHGVHR